MPLWEPIKQSDMKSKYVRVIGSFLLILSICIFKFGNIDPMKVENVMSILVLSLIATVGFICIMCPFDTNKKGQVTFS